MITKKEIKRVVSEKNKKISKGALIQLRKKLETFVRKIIADSAKNAELSGRIIIKSEDIPE